MDGATLRYTCTAQNSTCTCTNVHMPMYSVAKQTQRYTCITVDMHEHMLFGKELYASYNRIRKGKKNTMCCNEAVAHLSNCCVAPSLLSRINLLLKRMADFTNMLLFEKSF